MNTPLSLSSISSFTVKLQNNSNTYTQTINDPAILSNLKNGYNKLVISEPTIINLFNNSTTNNEFTYSLITNYDGVSEVEDTEVKDPFIPRPSFDKSKPIINDATKENGGYVGVNITWIYPEYLFTGPLSYFWQFGENVPVEFPSLRINRNNDGTMSAMTDPLDMVTAEYNNPENPYSVKVFVKNNANQQSDISRKYNIKIGLDPPVIYGGMLYPERVFKAYVSVNGILLQNRAIFQLSNDNGITWGNEQYTVFDPTKGNSWSYYYTSPVLDVGITYKIRCYYIGSIGYANGKKSPYNELTFTVENRLLTNHPTYFSQLDGYTFKIKNNRTKSIQLIDYPWDIDTVDVFTPQANRWHFYQFKLTKTNSSGVPIASSRIFDLSSSNPANSAFFTWETLTPGDYWKLELVDYYNLGLDNTPYFALWQVPNNLDTTYGQITNLTVRKSANKSFLFEFDYSSNYNLDGNIILCGVRNYGASYINYSNKFPITKGRNVIDTANFKVDNSTVDDLFYLENNNQGMVAMKIYQNEPEFRSSNTVIVNTNLL